LASRITGAPCLLSLLIPSPRVVNFDGSVNGSEGATDSGCLSRRVEPAFADVLAFESQEVGLAALQCWFRRSHVGIIARVFVAVKGTGAIAPDLPVLTHPTADLFARS
jgi:hypothetical protein